MLRPDTCNGNDTVNVVQHNVPQYEHTCFLAQSPTPSAVTHHLLVVVERWTVSEHHQGCISESM